MTKAELVEQIAEKINLTKKDTERVVNIVFGSIMSALSQGDKVELRGFGSFRVRSRNSRDGRNPRTGEAVAIPPKNVPFFKAGKELRQMVDYFGSASFEDDGGAPEPSGRDASAKPDSEAHGESSEDDSLF
ncbi:MAG: integration host factor subunit beta [Nitrospinae bacterium]|nr:integration host factor subunit beta [Nitrospinota bacterium]